MHFQAKERPKAYWRKRNEGKHEPKKTKTRSVTKKESPTTRLRLIQFLLAACHEASMANQPQKESACGRTVPPILSEATFSWGHDHVKAAFFSRTRQSHTRNNIQRRWVIGLFSCPAPDEEAPAAVATYIGRAIADPDTSSKAKKEGNLRRHGWFPVLLRGHVRARASSSARHPHVDPLFGYKRRYSAHARAPFVTQWLHVFA